jgi:sec-independent protein translocase protein TatB
MFDIGFFELVLLGVVGLLVLGPERLPHAIRMGSAYLGKVRRAVTSVKEEFEREVNLQEMQQRIKEQMEKAGLDDARQSLQQLKSDIENPNLSSENSIGGSLKPPAPGPEDDPDTRHNPTLPENEAEPLPEPELEPEPENLSGDATAAHTPSEKEPPKV